MTVDAIIEKIRADARLRAAGIEEEGRAQAEAILKRSEEEGRRAYARHCEEGRREGALISGRIVSRARMDARTAVSEARSALVRDCFARTEERLGALADSPEYPEILGRLIREGMRELGPSGVVIEGRSEDLPLIRELTAGKVPVVAAPDGAAAGGGVIVRTEQGDRLVNQMFAGRLQRMRRALIPEIAAVLFEGGRGA
ncbi:MAG: V-type proton ATPase subunit E [Methanomicrobiaceae archaeon]|nr:V-type proton ATPase subunit E [Methanomicrobiaceae archaeon]MDD5419121.1 V-type ATP synthase subunit E family protein [Methanomicrobiaceae archaeon]